MIESSNWYIWLATRFDGAEEDMENEDKGNDENDPDNNANEGGAAQSAKSGPAKSEVLNNRKPSCCGYVVYFSFRTLIVMIVIGIAFLIPNLSILITFCGAVLGTIVNILLPVLFYNRAYNNTGKNRALRKKEEMMGDQDESQNLMGD